MRRRLMIGSAGLGSAMLLAVVVAPAAVAGDPPLPVYDSGALGQGLIASAAIRPSILESAGSGGLLYASTKFNSLGGGVSQSLAAPVFPGTAAIGALTPFTSCGGLKGWVEARYPPTPACKAEQQDSAASVNLAQLSAATSHMRATARLAEGTSEIAGQDIVVRPSGQEPLLRIGALTVGLDGARNGPVDHASQISAGNIRLLDDAVVIGSLTARAHTHSDGTTASAEASMAFADVWVTIDGDRHEATITNRGIRVTDPEMTREQNIALTETIRDELLRAGISISSSSPIEVVEGASAEAAVGGLIFTFSGVIPSAPIPTEVAGALAPVIDEIDTKCVFEITHEDRPDELAPVTDNFPRVPLCFGAGVLPGPGSVPTLSLTIGAASSFSVAAEGTTFEFPTGPTTPPFTPPFTPSNPTVTPFQPPVLPGTGAVTPPPPLVGPQPPLVGLVARLPDAALAWAGMALLIFAFGLMVTPSLRHARAG